MSKSTQPQQPVQKPEESLYDRFTEKSREIFESGQEKGAEAWDKAMELAREQMAAAGEFSSEQGEAFKRYLRRDLEQTVEDFTQLENEVGEKVFDRFSEKSREIFERGQEKGSEAWDKAMELAREQMAAAGEFSSEQGEVFKRYLRRDLKQTVADMNQLGKEAKENLHPARLGAGALSSLAKLLHATGGALTKLSKKTEAALTYQSGEVTMAGTLKCKSCNHEIHLTKTSVVPPCPECKGTKFRKGF